MSEELPGQLPLFHGTVGPKDVPNTEADRLRKIIGTLLGTFGPADDKGLCTAYVTPGTLIHYATISGAKVPSHLTEHDL